MNKIFFFDIDGTLGIHGVIPQENLEALKLLKEKGYLTFICTGRAPHYAQHLFQDLVSGLITCNGRYILYEGQYLYGKQFDMGTLKEYMKDFDILDCGALFVSNEVSCPYHLTKKEIDDCLKEYGENHISLDLNYPFYTFDIFYKDIEHRDKIFNYFQNKLVINDHGGIGNADCSTVGFDKGNAIAYLLKHFYIPKDHAYAFGDGYNDQAMFREVGHAIAMGNAVDILKEKATYITDDVDKNGIMKALKHEKVL